MTGTCGLDLKRLATAGEKNRLTLPGCAFTCW